MAQQNNIFKELDLHNKVHRSGFNLSHKVNFTAKPGELLPVLHQDLMFGDQFRMSANWFTRTRPVDTAAATKINEYLDFFFVPYRLLWKNAPQVHTNNTKNPVSATAPYSNSPVGTQTPCFSFRHYFSTNNAGDPSILKKLHDFKNSFGYDRAALSVKLLNHLGYGYISDANLMYAIGSDALGADQKKRYSYGGPGLLSLYPLLAYQCIYYNFFRNTQWEDNQPYNYNVDYLSSDAALSFPTGTGSGVLPWLGYWSNPTVFDLHYANYPKDLFFGVFPDAQYGDEAVVDLSVTPSVSVRSVDVSTGNYPGSTVETKSVVTDVSTGATTLVGSVVGANGAGVGFHTGGLYVDLTTALGNLSSKLSVLDLRKAQFLQKYKEIRGSGSSDYRTLVKKIFDVDVPDDLAGIPLYLGGRSNTISISEVENTNLANGGQVELKGKGVGSSNTDVISFEAKEPGIIMAIYHAAPVVDYSLNALHFDVVKTEYDDFANPLFDQLGFEPVPTYFLDLAVVSTNVDGDDSPNMLGYTTRYFGYKTAVDRTLGDFRETSKTWLAPIDFDYLTNYMVGSQLQVNANFFRVNPSILDPIFQIKCAPQSDQSTAVGYAPNLTRTDQLMVFMNFDISAIRPLDRQGVPY